MSKHTQPTLPADHELVLPERVTIALGELAGAFGFMPFSRWAVGVDRPRRQAANGTGRRWSRMYGTPLG
jgi:hypothetical protein